MSHLHRSRLSVHPLTALRVFRTSWSREAPLISRYNTSSSSILIVCIRFCTNGPLRSRPPPNFATLVNRRFFIFSLSRFHPRLRKLRRVEDRGRRHGKHRSPRWSSPAQLLTLADLSGLEAEELEKKPRNFSQALCNFVQVSPGLVRSIRRRFIFHEYARTTSSSPSAPRGRRIHHCSR